MAFPCHPLKEVLGPLSGSVPFTNFQALLHPFTKLKPFPQGIMQISTIKSKSYQTQVFCARQDIFKFINIGDLIVLCLWQLYVV